MRLRRIPSRGNRNKREKREINNKDKYEVTKRMNKKDTENDTKHSTEKREDEEF